MSRKSARRVGYWSRRIYRQFSPELGSRSWHKNRIYFGNNQDPDTGILGYRLAGALFADYAPETAGLLVRDEFLKKLVATHLDARWVWDMQLDSSGIEFPSYEAKEKFAAWAILKYPEIVNPM